MNLFMQCGVNLNLFPFFFGETKLLKRVDENIWVIIYFSLFLCTVQTKEFMSEFDLDTDPKSQEKPEP